MTPPDHVGDDGTPHAGDGVPALSTARLRGVLDGTYANINGAQLVSPGGLRRWYAALGDARFGSASIAVVGDSITVGAYSNNNAGVYNVADETTFAAQGFVGQLRSLFAAQYGADPGEGIIRLDDKRVTVAGASAFGTGLSFHSTGTSLPAASGATVTVALPACTGFDILLWTPFGASASFTYTIDGGSNQTGAASPTGTQDVPYKVTATGLSNTTHTLVISAPASGGAIYPWAVRPTNGVTTGVQVHRFGKSGATTMTALDIGITDGLPNPGPNRAYRNALGSVGANADLVVVPLGTNDQANQSPTPTAYAANLQAFITYVTGTLNKCVLLTSEPRRQTPGTSAGYTEANYYDQMKALALANDHVAYLDIAPVFGTYAQATATSMSLMADTIHPNRKGHGVLAQTLFQALTLPVRYPGT